MISSKRKPVLALCAALLMSCSSVGPLDPPVDALSEGIPVRVSEMLENANLPGVRVFVLDSQGKELFSAITNAAGTVMLPSQLAELKPRYVLAELAGFYVMGLVWRDDATGYAIPMSVVPHEGMRISR